MQTFMAFLGLCIDLASFLRTTYYFNKGAVAYKLYVEQENVRIGKIANKAAIDAGIAFDRDGVPVNDGFNRDNSEQHKLVLSGGHAANV